MYSYTFIFLEAGWFKKMNRKKFRDQSFWKKNKKNGQLLLHSIAINPVLGRKKIPTSLPKDLLYATLAPATKARATHSTGDFHKWRRAGKMEKCPPATDEEWRRETHYPGRGQKSCRKECCRAGDNTGTGTGTHCHTLTSVWLFVADIIS